MNEKEINKYIQELKLEFEEKLRKLEMEIKENTSIVDYELTINVMGSDNMEIGFYVEGFMFLLLGFIVRQENTKAKCYFFPDSSTRTNWETWKKHGFKTKETKVFWNGMTWRLTSIPLINGTHTMLMCEGSLVYNFKTKFAFSNIEEDGDLLEKDSDGRILLF